VRGGVFIDEIVLYYIGINKRKLIFNGTFMKWRNSFLIETDPQHVFFYVNSFCIFIKFIDLIIVREEKTMQVFSSSS